MDRDARTVAVELLYTLVQHGHRIRQVPSRGADLR